MSKKKDEDKKAPARPRGRNITVVEVSVNSGVMTIGYGGFQLDIPTDRLAELNEKMHDVKQKEIERLQDQITSLQRGDTSPQSILDTGVDSTISASGRDNPNPPLPKPKKDGYCYSCDKPMEAKSGQPCAVCKKFSHKTCLENNVCAVCLDNA